MHVVQNSKCDTVMLRRHFLKKDFIRAVCFSEVKHYEKIILPYRDVYPYTSKEFYTFIRETGRLKVLKNVLSIVSCPYGERFFENSDHLFDVLFGSADFKKRKKMTRTCNTFNHDGETLLHYAVKTGNVKCIKRLLRYGADLNVEDGQGRRPIDVAIQTSKPRIVLLLLQQGLDPELNNNSLTIAVEQVATYSRQIVNNLIKCGFTIQPKDYENPFVFHNAVEGGYINVLEELLKHGADINIGYPLNLLYNFEQTDEPLLTADVRENDTPLHTAILLNQNKVAKYLIKKGADINIPNTKGKTAIDYAVRFDESGKILKKLLKLGARVSNCEKSLRNAFESNYLTNAELVLLAENASMESIDTEFNGKTLLHISAEAGREEICALLLNNGAYVNAETKKTLYKTPLHLAVSRGQYKVSKFLLKMGAKVNAADAYCSTPLHEAARFGQADCLDLLINSGADINATDASSKTALFLAVEEKRLVIVRLLLKYNADINISTENSSIIDAALGDRSPYISYMEQYARRNIFALLIHHLLKLSVANFYVSDKLKVTKTVLPADFSQPIEDECKAELEMLKNEKICDTQISFNILMGNPKYLRSLLRNKSVNQILVPEFLRDKFPHYGDMLILNLTRAKARNSLLELGHIIFPVVFKRLPKLPFYCIEKIFNNMSNKELASFIEAIACTSLSR